MTTKCQVCGETEPYPAWFCLRRDVAEKDQPCTYSVEGHIRFCDRAREKLAAIHQPAAVVKG